MAILLRHKNSIYGLNDDLDAIDVNIGNLTTTRQAQYGNLALLSTTEKSALVPSINELHTTAQAGSDSALKKTNNLSDLQDVALARTNLDVLDKTGFDNALQIAKIALGTNHTVADIAERDALTNLSVDDRVLVLDSGDGTWANYKPTAIDGATGAGTDWVLFQSQQSLDNAADPATIRITYISNADTNAYTDAEKAKVDSISVSALVDLNTVIVSPNLVTDMTGLVFGEQGETVPSVNAAKAYIEGVASVGGLVPSSEERVVADNKVTLEFPPINGIAGICNFAQARYVDSNGVSFDASLQSTADPKIFQLALPTPNMWDGFTITVQYYHFLDMSNYEETVPDGGSDPILEGVSGVESTATDDDFDGWIDQGILPE